MQGYRDYLEQTSYKVYISNRAKELVSMLSGSEIETSWIDIIHDLDNSATPDEPQTETEAEIKSRMLAKLNGKEVEQVGCI